MADLEKTAAVETADAAPLDTAKGAEIMEKYEKESRTRKFTADWLNKLVYVLCLAFTLYHLAYASGIHVLQMVNIKHHAIHVGLVLVIGFLLYPAFKKSSRKKVAWYDWVLFALSAVMPIYVFIRYPVFISTGFQGETIDIIMGTILILLVLECSRRLSGPALSILSIIFLAYGLFGRYLPGIFMHRGYNWHRIVTYLTTDIYGIYGTSVKVAATYIVLFIIFGEVMNKCGMGQFFNDIANALAGHTKGGPAKVAVLASGFLGSINGSAVANVVGTGTFTIPLMKSRGYKPQFAGGVEAVASTGGQILPPVMGSGAFLMVAFTEQKYIAIVIAAVIPALLYYWGCAVAVMSQTEIAHVTLMDPKDIPKSREVMKDGWIYLLIIAVLLYCLLVAQYSPLYSALWATCAVPVVMLFDKKKRFTLKTIPSAMVKSGFSAMSIVIGCACAGIVVGMVSITGIGVIFGDMMIQAAHNMLFPSLVFTAITCIVLGMGLPTTAAYVIAASILAPSLIKLGLAPLTAHLFVFYFACLSAITPPVALAAYAGAGIAKTNPMTTAVEACKLGFAGFMVPFAFCYNPAMMMQGSVGEIISVAISAIIGVAIMSAGFQGWLLWKLNWLERIVFIAGGLLMFIPGTLTDIAGLVIAVALLLVNVKKWEKGPKFIMDKHKAKQEQK